MPLQPNRIPKNDDAALPVYRRQRFADAAFALSFVLLFAYFVFFVRYGVQSADESFYFTIPHRLTLGNRLVVDEWQLSQLSALFQYLPFRAYTALTGGTDGIILFFRELYVVVRMIFFAYLYAAFRRYRLWGLFGAVVFTAYNAFSHTTLNYYAMGNMALLLVCVLLFVRQKRSVAWLVFIGFVFACCVLIEPMAAALYLLVSVLTGIGFLRKRKGKPFLPEWEFLLNGRVWLFCTAGAVVCAALFLLILTVGASPQALYENLLQLAGDSEYNASTGHASVFKWHKVYMYLYYYGFVPAALNLAYFVTLLIRRRRLRENRAVYFAVGCLVSAVGMLIAVVSPHSEPGLAAILASPVPLSLFGLICYVFTKKKDRGFFAFLLAGFFFAALTDFSSEASVGCGCAVSAVAAVFLFSHVWGELREARGKKPFSGASLRRFVRVSAAAVLIVAVFCEGARLVLAGTWHIAEDHLSGTGGVLTEELTAGPLAGIRTNAALKKAYDDAREDLDRIREKEKGPLYVADLCPWYYIYADLPYGAYSAYYVEEDSRDRVLLYWDMHPYAKPGVIYVPYYNCDTYTPDLAAAQEKLRFFESVCGYELTEGKAGYILRVTRWYSSAA